MSTLSVYLLMLLPGMAPMALLAFIIWWFGRHPWKYH
jgi:hypothetical protein